MVSGEIPVEITAYFLKMRYHLNFEDTKLPFGSNQDHSVLLRFARAEDTYGHYLSTFGGIFHPCTSEHQMVSLAFVH